MSWETIRAATVSVGDVTPAGVVESIDYCGDLRLVHLTIGGVTYSRRFDDAIDRELGAYAWGRSVGTRVRLGVLKPGAWINADGSPIDWQTSSKDFPRGYRAGLAGTS